MTTPYSIIVPTEYGQMIVLRHDINQTNPLLKTGRAFDHDLISELAGIITEREDLPVFIDAGSCLGPYALALAPLCAEVHAFEPQRILANMIAGTMALNGVENVWVHNVALGAHEPASKIPVPAFDYHRPCNFGSIEFGERQIEPLAQIRGKSREMVEMTTLDLFCADIGVEPGLIKIDVEGMELDLLAGAEEIITRCRPVVLIEHIKVGERPLAKWFVDRQYTVKRRSGGNFLCLP